MRRTLIATLGLVFVLIMANALPAGDGTKEDLAKFQGTWQFLSHEKEGKALPEDEAKKITVTLKGDTWTVKFGDQVVQAGTQKLDATKKPKTIDALVNEGEGKGTTMLGIYKLEGDTLTVCFDANGKTRPKAFKTEPDSGQFMAVQKRLSK